MLYPNKKTIKKSALYVFVFFFILFLLNLKVTTRQGIDYVVYTKKIPLYLKLFSFFDRHFEYINLIKEITNACKNDEEKVLKIFEWTYRNIRKAPADFPVIDDHVWSIIVRGYGVDDQFQDVFTTLCNYAGVDAFFDVIGKTRKSLSFVKLKRGWSVFDAYHGVIFKNRVQQIANTGDIQANNWQMVSLLDGESVDYQKYFDDLSSVSFEKWISSRAAIQSPLRRFLFWEKYKK